MKKFKLKQWYPSLPKEWKNQSGLVSFNTDKNGHEMEGVEGVIWIIGLHEFKDEDHWELIEEEKPLFTTEDGLEVFGRNVIVWIVRNKTLEKIKIHSIHLNEYDFGHKVFYHEFNADKYILWNKPLLSLQDIDATIKGYLPEFDKLKKLVEGRIKG